MMDLMLEAVRYGYDRFVYTNDSENVQTGFAGDKIIDMQLSAEGFYPGDCDDMAVKVYNRAAELGVPRYLMAFAVCKGGDNSETQDFGWINHIGVLFRESTDDDARVYFIDNNYKADIFAEYNGLTHLLPVDVASERVWRNWYRTEWGYPINSPFEIWSGA